MRQICREIIATFVQYVFFFSKILLFMK